MSDYYYYVRAIKEAGWGLVLISLAVTVLVYVWVDRLEPDYQVHFSYLISLSERDKADDFRFDGYYALSATDLFAATMVSWIKTPEVIAAAFEKANLSIPSEDPRALARAVSSSKSGPQLIEITVRHKNKEEAKRLAEGLQAVMSENVIKYHEEGIPAINFRIMATEPWVGVNRAAVQVIVTSTFVLVLFVGLNIILLRASLAAGAQKPGAD